MKVIDLLNKIANGEEVPKRIRIDHWCYEFEWVEHDSNYYDKHEDIDLMSCLSMDIEELNYEVRELKEDKKIKYIDIWYDPIKDSELKRLDTDTSIEILNNMCNDLKDKIDEIIDRLNGDE